MGALADDRPVARPRRRRPWGWGTPATASPRELDRPLHIRLVGQCRFRSRGGDAGKRQDGQPSAAVPPVLSHPDFDGRSRNLTGSTPEWRSGGRGLSPPVGTYTPPRRQALLEAEYRSPARAGHARVRSRTDGGSVDLAAVDRVGGLRLAFGVLLHLGGDRDRLAVVRERARPSWSRCRSRCRRAAPVAAFPCDPRPRRTRVARPRGRRTPGSVGRRSRSRVGDVFGDVGRHDRYEVVSPDVPDEPVGARKPDHGVLQDPRRRLDQAVTLDEPLLVVVSLEVVQVA